MGVTLPKKGIANAGNFYSDSPTATGDKFEVIINQNVSPEGRGEVGSHELFSHIKAMFQGIYALKSNLNVGSGINPEHD